MFGHLEHEPVSEPGLARPRSHAAPGRRSFELLEHGRSTNQIAAELHLSKETVRNHIRHILQALGVHSRIEVAVARHEHLAGVG